MRILMTSPFSDGTGYSQAGINHALSIDSVGIDIVCRPIYLSGFKQDPPTRIQELMKKSLLGITHIIQHYLPQMYRFNGSCKNIGLFHYETDSIRPIGWNYHINNTCDAVVTCSSQNLEMIVNSKVKVPSFYIPQSVDVTKYTKQYKKLKLPTEGRYVFYAVGDWSYRKNYTTLIRAYLQSFSKRDNVVLILKTFISGKSPQESAHEIMEFIKSTKEKLRKHHVDMYPEIMVITDRLSEDEMCALHQHGNCFVSVEHGAGVCLPALDAVGFGKEVLAPAWGGHTDFLNGYNLYNSISGKMVPCFGMDNAACPYTDLYTCYENWFEVDFNSLCKQLRLNYISRCNRNNEKTDYINRYNFETIGGQWKKVLEQI